MSDEFVWLPKSDSLVKDYEAQNWNVVLIAQIFSNETYYCLSKDMHFINDELRNKLLTPLCVVKDEYRDCLVLFKKNPEFSFIWQNKKCFSINEELSEGMMKSPMGYFREKDKIVVKNVEKLIEGTKIHVKSAMTLLPLLMILITLIILVVAGLYLWLF